MRDRPSPYLPLFDRAQQRKESAAAEPPAERPRAEPRDERPSAEPARPTRPRDEILSVAELADRLRQRVQALGSLVVEGEVSGFKGPAPTGHLYFTLSDERVEASIACVMFRREAQAAGGDKITNGARIKLRATPDLFAPRGALQLIVSKVALRGEGDLAARREALKKKLAAEGLLEPSRKRRLPPDPRVIGVVTSASGAAFQDIVKVARRRGRVRIILAAAQVQGDAAPSQICRAIERLSRVREVDVIIVGRGGGSAEDLAAFDDESVARAIAASPKPIVAAVGHETDWSIACLVADVRAATPSQAAELVVPDDIARVERLRDARQRLASAMRGHLHARGNYLARLAARVRAPERALATQRQKLDELQARLSDAMQARVGDAEKTRDALERRLLARHPRAVLSEARHALAPMSMRLRVAMARALDKRRTALSNAAHKLDAISPLAVLSRGYAIALDEGGRAVRDAREVKPGDAISVRLQRGTLSASVTRSEPEDDP